MIERGGDRKVLAALTEYGSDLARPHHTIHYLYFKSLPAAQAAAEELDKAGYQNLDVHVAPTTLWKRLFGAKEYACVAETHAVPSEQNVFATTDWMNALASRHGGEYDGWEAGIVK